MGGQGVQTWCELATVAVLRLCIFGCKHWVPVHRRAKVEAVDEFCRIEVRGDAGSMGELNAPLVAGPHTRFVLRDHRRNGY